MSRMDGPDQSPQVPDLEELEKEVEFTAYQASGPGGQHRNRTFSAIRAKHLPTGIVVTAAAPDVPESLVGQLAPHGRMVVPVGVSGDAQELLVVSKDSTGAVTRRSVLPVAFVPMVPAI